MNPLKLTDDSFDRPSNSNESKTITAEKLNVDNEDGPGLLH